MDGAHVGAKRFVGRPFAAVVQRELSGLGVRGVPMLVGSDIRVRVEGGAEGEDDRDD
ncbi:hypothetical protein D3C83_113070 [compost metagenome]